MEFGVGSGLGVGLAAGLGPTLNLKVTVICDLEHHWFRP